MSYTIGIIGAGNGGQAMAGYFKLAGNKVRVYDTFGELIDKLKERKHITLKGAVEGDVVIDAFTKNMEEVVRGVDVVMVVIPSLYHRDIAKRMAPYLEDDQVIFLNPGNAFGALAFKKSLEDAGCHKSVIIAESNTLLFACRANEVGVVTIGGKKERLLVSSLPANKIEKVNEILSPTIKEIELCETVLETSFDSTNAMVHPVPSLMNASWSESGATYKYYYDGIGPTVGTFLEKIDGERVDAGEKYGLVLGKTLFSLYMQNEIEYNAYGDTLAESFNNVKAYNEIFASNEVKTRYIFEDVPMGLVPFAEVGELVGCNMENTKLIIKLCENMFDEDFSTCENCRNAENLGIAGMTKDEFIHYAKTGEK